MAKSKKTAGQVAPAEEQPSPGTEPVEVTEDVVDENTLELATDTLTGDLRDFILDRLRHEQSKRPWHERSEADQRDTVHQVEVAVRDAVRQAIEIIAGGGARSIKATLDSVTVKDGIKAALTMSKHDPQRYGLMDAQGKSVLLIVADPETFTGERSPVEIKPDQSTLLGEGVMVQHSAPNGSADTPFH